MFHRRNVSSRWTMRSHLWQQHGSNDGLPERMWSIDWRQRYKTGSFRGIARPLWMGGGVCKLILQSYQCKFCRVTFAESLRELIFLFPKLLSQWGGKGVVKIFPGNTNIFPDIQKFFRPYHNFSKIISWHIIMIFSKIQKFFPRHHKFFIPSHSILSLTTKTIFQ